MLLRSSAEESSLTGGPVQRRQPGRLQLCMDPDASIFTLGIAPGWLSDFLYFSANNHPLHGILSCSPQNRFLRMERIAMEIAVIAFTSITANYKKKWTELKEVPDWLPDWAYFLTDPYWFTLAMVTIPGFIYRKLLFFLFTVPCCIASPDSGGCMKCCSGFFTWIFETMGYLIVALAVGLLATEYFTYDGENYENRNKYFEALVWVSVLGRVNGWGVYWAMYLGLQFNPWLAIGQPDPKVSENFVVTAIALGQWRIDKQRFQNHCLNILDKVQNGEIEDLEGESSDRPSGGLSCWACGRSSRIVHPAL